MKYLVVTPITFRTPGGVKELQRGDIFKIKDPEPIKTLINSGEVIPVLEDREWQTLLDKYRNEGITAIAVRLYSRILDSFLWVVADEKGIEALRIQGVKEAIYTEPEIKQLKNVDIASLRMTHNIKTTFLKSIVKEVKKKDGDIECIGGQEENKNTECI
jgi:3-deoxy-D-manno-octulosonate 8-phosphate phosphatase KdsC-like HAD superfamily phosphatase